MIILKHAHEVPEVLGLGSSVARTISNALRKHAQGVVTILEINRSVLELHRLCIEENYPAILKPMFFKNVKSCKDSALAGFYTVNISEENKHDYRWLQDHRIEPLPLHYPLSHLRHLLFRGDVTEIRVNGDGTLKILDKENSIYIAKANDVLNAKPITINGIDDPFFENHAGIELSLFLNDGVTAVNALGIKTNGIDNAVIHHLVIADIDAHAYGEYVGSRNVDELTYNTGTDVGRGDLRNAIENKFYAKLAVVSQILILAITICKRISPSRNYAANA